MGLIKKILVTTDLSEESTKSFQLAKYLAETHKAELNLLAVIEDPAQIAMYYAVDFPVLPQPDIQKQLVASIGAELSKLVDGHFVGQAVKQHVKVTENSTYAEIIKFSGEHSIDLIVMATHGRTGFRHLLIGSVAERVARESTCPVMIVPSKR